MKNIFKQLTSDGLIYGLGSAFSGLAGFILIPFLINSLNAHQYGRYAYAEACLGIFLVVCGLGLNIVFPAQYGEKKASDRARLVGASFVTYVLYSTGVVSIFFLAYFVFRSFSMGEISIWYLLMISVISVLETVWGFMALLMRLERTPWLFFRITVLQLVVNLIATIILVKYSSLADESIMLGRIIADIFVVFSIVPVISKYRLVFDKSVFYKLLKEGVPFIPATLSTIWVAMSPRFLLNYFATTNDVGIFSMNSKLAGIVSLIFLQPFALAWTSTLFKIKEEAAAEEIYARIFTYYCFVGVFLSLILSMTVPVINYFLHATDFEISTKLIAISSLGIVASGLMYPLNIGIYIRNETLRVVPVFICSAALAGILGAVFTSQFGILGAVSALLIVYISQAIALWKINKAIYPIRLEWVRLIKLMVVLFGSFFAFVFLLEDIDDWRGLVKPMGYAVTVIGLLVSVHFFDTEEISAFRTILKKRILKREDS